MGQRAEAASDGRVSKPSTINLIIILLACMSSYIRHVLAVACFLDYKNAEA